MTQHETQQTAARLKQITLRCSRCGGIEFHLSALTHVTDGTVHSVHSECADCGSTELPGYLPLVYDKGKV